MILNLYATGGLNLANTNWQMGTHLRVLSDSFPMNTSMTGFRLFSASFAFLCFGGKYSHSIGRVQMSTSCMLLYIGHRSLQLLKPHKNEYNLPKSRKHYRQHHLPKLWKLLLTVRRRRYILWISAKFSVGVAGEWGWGWQYPLCCWWLI